MSWRVSVIVVAAETGFVAVLQLDLKIVGVKIGEREVCVASQWVVSVVRISVNHLVNHFGYKLACECNNQTLISMQSIHMY